MFTTQFFVGLVAKIAKAIAIPVLFFKAGSGWLRRRLAERGVKNANEHNALREELHGLTDDELNERMRDAQK